MLARLVSSWVEEEEEEGISVGVTSLEAKMKTLQKREENKTMGGGRKGRSLAKTFWGLQPDEGGGEESYFSSFEFGHNWREMPPPPEFPQFSTDQ